MGELMKESWKTHLKFNPLPNLLASPNKAIVYFSRRDLLEKDVNPLESLWELPPAVKLLRKQQKDGAWKYPGGKPDIRTQQYYNQIETYRNLGELVEKYGFTRKHPTIKKAVDFLFQFQTNEGDFRGIYGTNTHPTIRLQSWNS